MSNDTEIRGSLIEYDNAPRTDADVLRDATGKALKGANFKAWDDRAAGGYTNASREACITRAQTEAAKLPPLGEACDRLAGQIRAERRTTVTARLADCRINADGLLERGGKTVELLDQAYHGLTQRAPRDVSPALRGNVNAWIGRKGDAEVNLRILRPEGRTPAAFAAVSDRYQPFDGDEAADLIKRTLPAECRGSVKYQGDGGRWQVDAVLARPFTAPGTDRAEEIHSIALRFRGADNGTGSVQWDAKAIRWLCANGIHVADTALLGRVRHVGNRERFVAGLVEATIKAATAAESFAARWGYAGGQHFTCADSGEALAADEAIHRLVSHGSLHVPHVRDLEEQVLKAWEAERGNSVTSVLNAATRLAHEGADSWKSPWYQDDLEDQAGALLYQPVWTLAPVETAEA
jgi:hypothetical protein